MDLKLKQEIMITKKEYLEAKKIVQEYENVQSKSDVSRSSPIIEGKIKSNVKNNTQTRRLAPPPPPIKRWCF